ALMPVGLMERVSLSHDVPVPLPPHCLTSRLVEAGLKAGDYRVGRHCCWKQGFPTNIIPVSVRVLRRWRLFELAKGSTKPMARDHKSCTGDTSMSPTASDTQLDVVWQ
ncbi:MAG: hypothetical protein J7516_14290, partial [Shinella sp.]|nr:hypothetical protein [Shinella sp.]